MSESLTTCPKLKPLPEGIIEHRRSVSEGLPPNLYGGVVALSDGAIMLAYPKHAGLKPGDAITSECRLSQDNGKTWSAPKALNVGMGINGMIRLKSGKLAAYGETRFPGELASYTSDQERRTGPGYTPVFFSSSADDGKTWIKPVEIHVYPGFYPYLHSLTQLSSGRLILAGYWQDLNAGRPDEGLREGAPDTFPYTQFSWGLWRGRVLFCEGHRGVEMSINLVYYSDDEGLTWKQCVGGIFGWFDERGVPNGEGGIIDVCEPNIAETPDGRLLMFMRSKTGRLLQSYSLDQGETWLSVLPTDLSASQTSPQLHRIPGTGNLLCIWNQVSSEEIRRGFQRGRLSAAISRDNGLTWENFKTLELQEGMEDTARISPEFPIARRVVGRASFGVLPDGFVMFSQPVVDIVGDNVFIRYARMWPIERRDAPSKDAGGWPQMLWPRAEDRGAEMRGEDIVMRVYPLKWFLQ